MATASIMQDLLFLSLAVLAYTFVGYPIVLGALARALRREAQQGDELPTVTIIMAAHQEAAVIRDKVENFAVLDYPHERLSMLIVSDGSTDGTDEIVREHAGDRVTLIRQESRAGKASALNLALQHVDTELLVFTDANVLFDAAAIRKLVRHFTNPDVGAVTGVVQLVDTKTGYAESEGAYYRYERFLQQAESDLHSVIGVDGALYAARRELVKAPPATAILDDFVISMEIAKTGKRIIYDRQALAIEDAAPTVADEFRRKVRVATGAFQSLLHGWGVPRPNAVKLSFCYWSHKVLRWLAPVFLLVAFVSNAAIATTSDPLTSLFVLQCLFYVLAVIGLLAPSTRGARSFAIPMYFTMMNAAFAVGLYRFLAHGTGGSWTPNARSRINTDASR